MDSDAWQEVARQIADAIGRTFTIDERTPATGGCINSAWTIGDGSKRYFVKVNEAARLPMFEAEAAGLAELHRSNSVRVPRAICAGSNTTSTWLVLEHLRLMSRDASADALLGAALANLHRTTADTYGWDRDNTIGSTPQSNARSEDWPTFWRDARLAPQLALAMQNGYGGKLQAGGAELLSRLDGFFRSYEPRPSLLHGDLWSGNAAADAEGNSVIFDPAVYYGDREVDIAMTELFGGFSSAFYSAYETAWRLDEGYGTRRDLYNLYHVLNHLNLFGRSYLAQAQQMIDRLLLLRL